MRVYFDNAATTPLDPSVIAAMTEAMHNYAGNPSSIHKEGRTARAAVEEARKRVAKLLNASIGEVFFTSGGTEANNMVLKNAVRDLGVQRIISSRIEHHAVLHTLERLATASAVQVDYVALDTKGRVNLENLENLLRGSSARTLVSLMHANNEIGTMIDLQKVGELCQQYGALFHSDTVQTMGYYPIDVSKTKIHFLNGAAHKFHGPKGVGFVYINNETMLKPFIDGGSQERNMRGGTENVYGIIGLAKALELAYANLEERQKHMENLHKRLKNKLLERFADIQVISNFDQDTEGGQNHFKILNVSFPLSPKAELLLFNLDIAGIAASGGSACSSGVEGGSHVLTELGIDPDRKCIRFSFSHLNTVEEVDFLVEKLEKMTPLKA
jgi:cysteine desulfurase